MTGRAGLAIVVERVYDGGGGDKVLTSNWLMYFLMLSASLGVRDIAGVGALSFSTSRSKS